MRRTITLIHAAAYRASSAGIPGVNQNDRNTSNSRLVLDFLPEIVERPGVVLSPLSLANSYPFADTLEIFKCNPASGVFRSLHQLFGDAVVHVFGKATFFAAAFLEQAFGRLRAFGLQFRSEPGITVAYPVHLSAGVAIPVAVRGDVLHAEINAEKLSDIFFLRRFNITGGEQVELPVYVDKIAFTTLAGEKFPLAFSADKGYLLPTTNCPDRDFRLREIVGQDAIVKCNRAKRAEYPFGFAVNLVGVSDLRNAAHSDLCAEWKFLPNVVVGKFVERKLTEYLVLPCLLADVIASGVCYLKRLLEKLRLFWRRKEFHFRGQFHGHNYNTSFNTLKGKERAFLPQLKPGVSSPSFR